MRTCSATCLLLGAVLLLAGLTACGGAAASSHNRAPVVVAFSPYLSPMDFNNRQQNPTFTDGMLTVSTDPSYPGEIVIYFRDRTELDPSSVFLGGVPALGLDLSALQILRYIPGTGNVELALSSVVVEDNRIRCIPATLPLPDGQYSIGVFKNIKNTDGVPLQFGPVFHAFTVGQADTVNPFVVTTSPVDQAEQVGAGAPPPTPPSGVSESQLVDVRTNIFGPSSPDIVIRFNEPVKASTVNASNVTVVDSGANTGGGSPPAIPPLAGYPELKSQQDLSTLPSNGHEIVWRPDPGQGFGGFPFGTKIRVTVTGAYDTQAAYEADLMATGGMMPQHTAPIEDLSGNKLLVSYEFQFSTLKPPNLPENPFPEYAVWWAGSDRVGVIDTINMAGLAELNFGNGTIQFPQNRVPRNSWLNHLSQIPEYTDQVANAQHLPGFEPTEISIDCRTNAATCHTWVYVMSPNTSEIVIVHSRTSIPVAVLSTPTPGGLSNQTGGGQAANVLLATNRTANTMTIFDLSNQTPGTTFLNGPLFVLTTKQTGNTPTAVTISTSPTGAFNRDPFQGGPPVPLIMYIDYTDGVVNTTTLSSDTPIKQFGLGGSSGPNDVVMTPCFGPPAIPPIMFAAISESGTGVNEGKVAYYVAGPNCSTGTSTAGRPDSLVGDLSGFNSPAGLDNTFSVGNGTVFFAVAESGANRVVTLGLETGANNLPSKLNEFNAVGANPVNLCHRPAWLLPCGAPILSGACIPAGVPQPAPGCYYRNIAEMYLQAVDQTLAVSQDLYICAKGASQVSIVNMITGAFDEYSPIAIPGVRYVATTCTQ
jgi:hypothetical protein